MRVIAGKAKGTQLKTPDGMLTRPTTDRVKEALFSILQFDLPGTRVLDLFGGTKYKLYRNKFSYKVLQELWK